MHLRSCVTAESANAGLVLLVLSATCVVAPAFTVMVCDAKTVVVGPHVYFKAVLTALRSIIELIG